MPYEIKQISPRRYELLNSKTGKLHSKHASKKNVEAQLRILNSLDNLKSPSNNMRHKQGKMQGEGWFDKVLDSSFTPREAIHFAKDIPNKGKEAIHDIEGVGLYGGGMLPPALQSPNPFMATRHPNASANVGMGVHHHYHIYGKGLFDDIGNSIKHGVENTIVNPIRGAVNVVKRTGEETYNEGKDLAENSAKAVRGNYKPILKQANNLVLPSAGSAIGGAAGTAATDSQLGGIVGATLGGVAGKMAAQKANQEIGEGLKRRRKARMHGGEIPQPHSRLYKTEGTGFVEDMRGAIGMGVKKRKGRFAKGSAEAKAWGEKMRS